MSGREVVVSEVDTIWIDYCFAKEKRGESTSAGLEGGEGCVRIRSNCDSYQR